MQPCSGGLKLQGCIELLDAVAGKVRRRISQGSAQEQVTNHSNASRYTIGSTYMLVIIEE
jgi:hypothetical protein